MTHPTIELLKDEISEIDFVGPTLQSLKRLLDNIPESPAEHAKFDRMVHGILSACLVNIDEMRFVVESARLWIVNNTTFVRGREGPACRKKIKSNILAAVLILTVLPPSVKISQAAIEHSCFLISQSLVDSDEVGGMERPSRIVLIREPQMSITAAHCAKTLVLTSVHGSPALRQCVRLLLPGMIECIAKISATQQGNSSELQSQIVGEIFKAFAALFTATAEEQSTYVWCFSELLY